MLLILRNVSRHQEGIYRCSVFNSSGLSPNDAVPTDANVTIYVGGKSFSTHVFETRTATGS